VNVAGQGGVNDSPTLTQPWRTQWVDRPAGYRCYEVAHPVGRGDDVFERAAEELLTWQVKTRSGFDVVMDGEPGPARVAVGQRPTIRVRLGPFRLPEPARVIAVVDEESRRGFTYATEPGHPVTGEETFLVVKAPDGRVFLLLRSASAPGLGVWRFADPLVRLAQIVYRRRYARALRG
jgi:uncharacterized protein (UPF0548 family)